MKTMRKLTAMKRREDGSAELVTTLFMLPIAVLLILALIEVSMYFGTRTSVQNALSDATRQVAAYGGNDTRLNPSNTSVSAGLQASLKSNGRCTYSRCINSQSPRVTCGPTSGNVNGNGVPTISTGQAGRAGDEVACVVTYPYQGVTGGGWLLGFEGIAKPFTLVEYSTSEVGFR